MARTGDGSRLLPPHWNPCAGPQAGHTHLSGKLCSEMGGNSWQEASTLINHDSCLQALLIKCLLATGSQRHLSELGVSMSWTGADLLRHPQLTTARTGRGLVGAVGEGCAGQW